MKSYTVCHFLFSFYSQLCSSFPLKLMLMLWQLFFIIYIRLFLCIMLNVAIFPLFLICCTKREKKRNRANHPSHKSSLRHIFSPPFSLLWCQQPSSFLFGFSLSFPIHVRVCDHQRLDLYTEAKGFTAFERLHKVVSCTLQLTDAHHLLVISHFPSSPKKKCARKVAKQVHQYTPNETKKIHWALYTKRALVGTIVEKTVGRVDYIRIDTEWLLW